MWVCKNHRDSAYCKEGNEDLRVQHLLMQAALGMRFCFCTRELGG